MLQPLMVLSIPDMQETFVYSEHRFMLWQSSLGGMTRLMRCSADMVSPRVI